MAEDEQDPRWRRSSLSSHRGDDCVEVALIASSVAVRDSKDPDGPRLAVSQPAWAAFVDAARSGGLDVGQR